MRPSVMTFSVLVVDLGHCAVYMYIPFGRTWA